MLNFIREVIIVVLISFVAIIGGALISMRRLFRNQKKQTIEIVEKIEEIDHIVQEGREDINLIKLGLDELSKKDRI